MQEELSGIDELKKKTLQDEATLCGDNGPVIRPGRGGKKAEASDEGKRAEELKRILEKKKQDQSRPKSELADLVAPLTKALARIMKQGSSDRINLQHKNVFEQLLAYPSQVQDKDIAGSLEELQSHLATLGLKDKKKEKISRSYRPAHREKIAGKCQGQAASFEKEISDLESQIAESSQESLRLKEEIARPEKAKRAWKRP